MKKFHFGNCLNAQNTIDLSKYRTIYETRQNIESLRKETRFLYVFVYISVLQQFLAISWCEWRKIN